MPAAGLQVSAADLFLERDVLAATGGVRSLAALDAPRPLYLSVRDPSEVSEGPFNEDSVTITIREGKKRMNVAEFLALQHAASADFFEALSVDVPCSISSKKVRKSVELSLSWLDSCIAAAGKWQSKPGVFGVIQGAGSIEWRAKSARETAKRPVDGFTLASFGLGETHDQRTPLLSAIMRELPSAKPRLLPGVGSPDDVVQCVAAGVDLFNTTYPQLLTELGFALTLDLRSPAAPCDEPYKINLRDRKYQLDSRPLLASCRCLACRQHTRAYLHHLQNTHEMLFNVLLDIHNTQLYLEFFDAMRIAIEQKTFAAFSARVTTAMGVLSSEPVTSAAGH